MRHLTTHANRCNKCDFLIWWIFSFNRFNHRFITTHDDHWVTATPFRRRTVPIAIKCALCGTFITAVMCARTLSTWSVLCNMLMWNFDFRIFYLSRTHTQHCVFNHFKHIALCVSISHISQFADLVVIISIQLEISGKIKTKEYLFSLSRIRQTIFCASMRVRSHVWMRAYERNSDSLFLSFAFFMACVCMRDACVYFSMGI